MTLLSFPGDSLLPGKMRKLRRGGPLRGRTRYRVPRAATSLTRASAPASGGRNSSCHYSDCSTHFTLDHAKLSTGPQRQNAASCL